MFTGLTHFKPVIEKGLTSFTYIGAD